MQTKIQNAQLIKEKLKQFKIDVEMKEINIGSTVTQYTFRPADGVKLSSIKSLKDDLALALAAKSLRIEAPIPGQSLVGVEIPNQVRSIVPIADVVDDVRTGLLLALGKDVKGEVIISDLEKMPHLLIAGSTGSGKSMLINSFILTLLKNNTHEDLNLILIDPKLVEFGHLSKSKHLLLPVIHNVEDAINALDLAVEEMKRRYELLSKYHCRSVTEFNENETQKIPKIVIVIDELAELMIKDYKKEAEQLICRLAQMARAVGIHMIAATQRPSVDVITGLIKANMPTRIALSVASGIDSKTIIDSHDAKDLLGNGDMLYMQQGLQKIRVQAPYVSSDEIKSMLK